MADDKSKGRIGNLGSDDRLLRGPGPSHVFEVTDLTIPAGTDLNPGIVLADCGSYPPGTAMVGIAYLELAETLAELDGIAFGLTSDPTFASAVIGGSFTSFWAGMSSVSALPPSGAGFEAPTDTGLVLAIGPNRMDQAPTSADIHIVRARAAFLVI